MLRYQPGYWPSEHGYLFTHADDGAQQVNFPFRPRLSLNPSWGYDDIQTADLALSLFFHINPPEHPLDFTYTELLMEDFSLSFMLDKFVKTFMRGWQPEQDYVLDHREVQDWLDRAAIELSHMTSAIFDEEIQWYLHRGEVSRNDDDLYDDTDSEDYDEDDDLEEE